jgi:hypothetical protein
MRPIATAVLLALSVWGCGMAETPVAAPGAPAPARGEAAAACPLMVRFGSYASGVDPAAVEAVTAALKADRRAAEVTVRPWGREGERDLCVVPRSTADAAALAQVAQAAIPARTLNGYVDILLNEQRVFTTQPDRG